MSQKVLHELAQEDDPKAMYDGCFVPEYNRPCFGSIYIFGKLQVKAKWTTYWHELIHAVNDLSAFDHDHSNT